jgi:hypothetical protein
MFIGEHDGIHDGVGMLRCGNGTLERLFASSIDAVGEDDDRLSSRLLLHQFIRGEIDCIVKQSSAAVRSMRAALRIGLRVSTRRAIKPRHLQQIERGFQLAMRRRQILKQFHFMIEVEDKRFVLVVSEHLSEKGSAGIALLIQDTSLTQTGIDEQTERKGEIRVLGEIANGLELPVVVQHKIIFRQAADNLAVFVANRDRQRDDLDVDRDSNAIIGRGLAHAWNRD